jgi:hypothetical protein
MRKTALVFFTLLLVLGGCFIAGCSSLPFSGTPTPTETPQKVNAGLTGHENSIATQRYQFDEVVAGLSSPDTAAMWNDTSEGVSLENVTQENVSQKTVSPEKHINYIRGANLDENGDATSWTFVVDHGDQFSIVTYNNQGMIASNSPGTIQRTEIFIDRIITPGKLFEKNRAVIFNTTRTGTSVTRDLSLSGGNYTITISSGHGTPRILTFDAITGVLTSSND